MNLILSLNELATHNLQRAIDNNPDLLVEVDHGAIKVHYENASQISKFLEDLYAPYQPGSRPALPWQTEHRIHLSFMGQPDSPLDLSKAGSEIDVEVEGLYFQDQVQVSNTLSALHDRLQNLIMNGGDLLEYNDRINLNIIDLELAQLSEKYLNDEYPVLGHFQEGNYVTSYLGEGVVIGHEGSKVAVQFTGGIWSLDPDQLKNVYEEPGVGFVSALSLRKAQDLANQGQVTFYPETEPGVYGEFNLVQKKA